MIHLTTNPYLQMLEDAANTFPDECCGFLFGSETADDRLITALMVIDNAKEGDKRRRFEISAKDYLRAERYAAEHDLTLLGVYHSHPSHPAIPSEHDRLAALPFFSYVIVSLYEDGLREVRSWRLNEDRQFDQEAVNEPPKPQKTRRIRHNSSIIDHSF